MKVGWLFRQVYRRKVYRMLRIIFKIIGLQFACFCLLLLCCMIAGQEKGVFWFVLITMTLLMLTVVGKIVQRLR